MTINYGWFANIPDNTPLSVQITAPTTGGASLKVTAKRASFSDTRFFGQGTGNYLDVDFDDRDITVVQSGTGTRLFNNPINDGGPHSIEVIAGLNPTGGAEAFNYIVDGNDRGWLDSVAGSNDLWRIDALTSDAAAGRNGSISRATVKSDASTTVADWDGNQVLNAAGDGFITRTEANNNPSLAESGFDLKMYDVTSTSGNHIDLPAGTTWDFVSNFSIPASVTAGSTFGFTAPADFTTEAVTLGGLPLPFTFANPPDGTADAPTMGDVAWFPRFGAQQIQLRDDTAGLTAEQDADWQPSGTYEYITLTSDPSTTDPASICYGWTDPLVAGDQVVYDPAIFTVSGSGIITLVTTSETFTSQYFIIDDNGMQEETITQDSTGVTIPTVVIDDPGLIPTNTATQLTATTTGAATFLWEVLSAPAGSTATFTNNAVEDAEITVDTAGAYELRLTATNAAGDGSANDTITVNAGVHSTLTVTITDTPDGTYETYVINADEGTLPFDGNKAWSGGSATFTINGAAPGTNCVVSVLGATDGGLVRGVTV